MKLPTMLLLKGTSVPFERTGGNGEWKLPTMLLLKGTSVPFERTGGNGEWPPQKFGGGKMHHFRRITLFCLEKRLSKHKITIFSKTFGGRGPFAPLATPMATVPLSGVLDHN